jgi:hypothetical protein
LLNYRLQNPRNKIQENGNFLLGLYEVWQITESTFCTEITTLARWSVLDHMTIRVTVLCKTSLGCSLFCGRSTYFTSAVSYSQILNSEQDSRSLLFYSIDFQFYNQCSVVIVVEFLTADIWIIFHK